MSLLSCKHRTCNLQPVYCNLVTLAAETFESVSLIAHSDWSKDAAKRWMALAVLQANHHWQVRGPFAIKTLSDLFPYLQSNRIIPGCTLAGFDFPIGLPSAYASKAGITNFISTLPSFGHGTWAEFYLPADNPAQISLHRPFYPAKPGSSKRPHLEQGLGIPFRQLYRLCEIAHEKRHAACPLFWTLGSQQVGKAAISAWESLLAPAIQSHDLNLKIWPFSGSIQDLCLPENIVVVETYPAEFYGHLGVSFTKPVRRSKRRQVDRLAFAAQLLSWAMDHGLELDAQIINRIQDGFGSHLDGEDQFDSLVGLYGMINVIQGNHSIGEPLIPVLSNIEGWIFGQERPLSGI